MTPASLAVIAAERLPLPDSLLRAGIGRMVGRTDETLARTPAHGDREFARRMSAFPIADHTADANEQHYELPAEFFGLILGPRRKYSSCFYADSAEDLAGAEDGALTLTMAHAALEDGQDVLELGCGWGSLTLRMAETFPASRITAVSNSRGQRTFIESQLRERGLANVTVITADMNTFEPGRTYDRIVSVEMFEHMSNWRALLGRTRTWLRPDGRLFLHVFTHGKASYRFDHDDKDDWIAQHFFTGGIMPSHDLIRQYPDLYVVEADWTWSGDHYRRTADAWLRNFDRNRPAIMALLRRHYGKEAGLWRRRWRLFFLATAGLFGHRGGAVWGVSHYLLKPAPAP